MPTFPSREISAENAARLAAYYNADNFADVPDMLWTEVKQRVLKFERKDREKRAGNGDAVEAATEFNL